MTPSPFLSFLLLVITAATLFWMAVTDFKEFKIRNDLVVVLAVLYVLHAVVSGRWTTMPWNFGFAALASAAMLYAYSQQQMGGGDFKLLAAVFLWTGPWSAIPFALLLLVFVGLHYAASRFGWAPAQITPLGRRIPLAPSVAAALIGTFALGYEAPIA